MVVWTRVVAKKIVRNDWNWRWRPHACDPGTYLADAGWCSKFEASYIARTKKVTGFWIDFWKSWHDFHLTSCEGREAENVEKNVPGLWAAGGVKLCVVWGWWWEGWISGEEKELVLDMLGLRVLEMHMQLQEGSWVNLRFRWKDFSGRHL